MASENTKYHVDESPMSSNLVNQLLLLSKGVDYKEHESSESRQSSNSEFHSSREEKMNDNVYLNNDFEDIEKDFVGPTRRSQRRLTAALTTATTSESNFDDSDSVSVKPENDNFTDDFAANVEMAVFPFQTPHQYDLYIDQLLLINGSKCRYRGMIAQISGIVPGYCTVRVLKENPSDGNYDYITTTTLSLQKLLLLKDEAVSHILPRMVSPRKRSNVDKEVVEKIISSPEALALRDQWIKEQKWIIIANSRSKYDGTIAQVGGTYSTYGVWVHLFLKTADGYAKKSTNILLNQARTATEAEVADVKQWIVESLITSEDAASGQSEPVDDIHNIVDRMTKVEEMREWINQKQFVVITKPNSLFDGCIAQVRFSERRRGRPMRDAPNGNAVAFPSDGKNGFTVTVVDVDPNGARVATNEECAPVKKWIESHFPEVDYNNGNEGASEFTQHFKSAKLSSSNQWVNQRRWVRIVNARSKGLNGCIAQIVRKPKAGLGSVVANVYKFSAMGGWDVEEALIYPIQCKPLADDEVAELKLTLGKVYPDDSHFEDSSSADDSRDSLRVGEKRKSSS